LNKRNAIKETRQWLIDIVVGLNFCPFAAKVVEGDAIHFQADSFSSIEESLSLLIEQCEYLDEHKEIETSFILYTQQLKMFDDYLDFLDLANQLLEAQGYEGVYQLASFHPQYRFDNTNEGDAENYTNISPYPMLHLLREASLEKMLTSFTEPEKIPLQNVTTAKVKGVDFFIQYLKNIKKSG